MVKYRHGFISNSSSSSYIIIGNSSYDRLDPLYNRNSNTFDPSLITKSDFIEFGWGPYTVQDVQARIVFTMIQVEAMIRNPYGYDEFKGWKTPEGQMLIEVIKEVSDLQLIWKLPSGAYIDHQSRADEDRNIEMFKDKETLKQWIYCNDSKIVLDNDNH